MKPLDWAVITGASGKIGHAIALDLAAQGVYVLCVGRPSSCNETVAEIRDNGGSATAQVWDLANCTGYEVLPLAWLGRGLVVLAAGRLGPEGPLATTDLEEWRLTFTVNVLGNLAIAQAYLSAMKRAKFGRMVFLSGGGAAYPNSAFPAYSASKTALMRAVENLSRDSGLPSDFAAVCIAPGVVKSHISDRAREVTGEVKPYTSIKLTTNFVNRFITSEGQKLTGKYIHVKDDCWGGEISPDRFTLRRVS